ncbi:unnamed protein product [Strongylus vulgaris]|uniref:Uncharacterized protein n=1 Tax=Strongylus vulgaris TaxID=40348 RepID=A0A3P7IUG8_STRVU|nr:unnamed protein product [Strongylus vulgaris]
MKDTPYYYAIFIERYVFLLLDPQRSGKVSIEDLTATRLLDDLFDVLYEQTQDNPDQSWDVSQLSWCSVNNFWRVLEQFRRCDRDWSGMVSLEECRYLKEYVQFSNDHHVKYYAVCREKWLQLCYRMNKNCVVYAVY